MAEQRASYDSAHAHDAKTLDDAAVADLLEGAAAAEPATALDSKSDTSAAQQPARDAIPRATAGLFDSILHRLKSVAKKNSRVLALAGTSLALLLSTTIGFVSVAVKAPGLATMLFFIFVVLVPFAVAGVLREYRSATAQGRDVPPTP